MGLIKQCDDQLGVLFDIQNNPQELQDLAKAEHVNEYEEVLSLMYERLVLSTVESTSITTNHTFRG